MESRKCVVPSISFSRYATELLNTPHWVVTEDFHFKLKYKMSDFSVLIPKGYVFKQWDIPETLLSIIGKHNTKALLIYTYLNEHRHMRFKDTVINICSKTIENVLIDVLTCLNFSKRKRLLLYILFPFYRTKAHDNGYKIQKQAISFYLREIYRTKGYFK